MHPIHPMMVHFPIALLIASVCFDLLATRWRPDSFRDASLYTLIGGLGGTVLAVVTGSMAEDLVEKKGVPESVVDLHETLAYGTLTIFIGLLALRLLMRWGYFKKSPLVHISIGMIGVVVLIVTSYYGGNLVYDFG